MPISIQWPWPFHWHQPSSFFFFRINSMGIFTHALWNQLSICFLYEYCGWFAISCMPIGEFDIPVFVRSRCIDCSTNSVRAELRSFNVSADAMNVESVQQIPRVVELHGDRYNGLSNRHRAILKPKAKHKVAFTTHAYYVLFDSVLSLSPFPCIHSRSHRMVNPRINYRRRLRSSSQRSWAGNVDFHRQFSLDAVHCIAYTDVWQLSRDANANWPSVATNCTIIASIVLFRNDEKWRFSWSSGISCLADMSMYTGFDDDLQTDSTYN